MDFGFTEEQELLRATAREFCEKEITREKIREWEETLDFMPQDVWDKAASVGFFAAAVPEEYGGEGSDMVTAMVGFEEISKASTSVALGVGATVGFGIRPLNELGTPEQKQELLPKLAEGKLRFALALTEPAGGTDVLGAISTYADSDGDDFIINGQKIYITGAHVADYLTTVAITDRDNPRRANALSIIMVPADSPGIDIRLIPKVSSHCCGSCEVFYDNVRVPKANLLGTLNNGWYDVLSTLNPERIGVAMISVGLAESVFEDSMAYAKQREAFGKPIGQFQIIQHYLADMALNIELARNLVFKCAWLCDSGKPYHVEATMAGLFASKMALDAATVGMEIFGGYGVTMESDIQRYWRDSQQMVFSPISNEMSKNFIAQCYGLPKSF
ncbi:MAG: acyl-CoA dehydrogenase family protein [Candidatus Geothermincolia bacterium]